jgi:hypothetical protein
METQREQAINVIEKRAAHLMEHDPQLGREQAIAKVVEENPELYAAYRAGVAAGEPPEFMADAEWEAAAEVCADIVKGLTSAKAQAWRPIKELADKRVAVNKGMTFEQAVDEVCKENPELYLAYRDAEGSS